MTRDYAALSVYVSSILRVGQIVRFPILFFSWKMLPSCVLLCLYISKRSKWQNLTKYIALCRKTAFKLQNLTMCCECRKSWDTQFQHYIYIYIYTLVHKIDQYINTCHQKYDFISLVHIKYKFRFN